ncbi:MAG: hypothetical protein HY815_21695 [Candidatus Riflebacteria bacterium]|nr:hypothetical protein [Candidatus Riflebacteria bacterium]
MTDELEDHRSISPGCSARLALWGLLVGGVYVGMICLLESASRRHPEWWLGVLVATTLGSLVSGLILPRLGSAALLLLGTSVVGALVQTWGVGATPCGRAEAFLLCLSMASQPVLLVAVLVHFRFSRSGTATRLVFSVLAIPGFALTVLAAISLALWSLAPPLNDSRSIAHLLLLGGLSAAGAPPRPWCRSGLDADPAVCQESSDGGAHEPAPS